MMLQINTVMLGELASQVTALGEIGTLTSLGQQPLILKKWKWEKLFY